MNGCASTRGTDASLAAEVEEAVRERERLAGEMEALASFLTSEGMPGIHGPLVDEEGFPRADIDVHAVREARHRLACLKTDYRTVQGRLEELVLRVHAKCTEFEAVTQQLSLPHEQPRSRDVPGELKDAPPPLHESEGPAFAVVDVIHPGSPSSTAGLVCGDRVLRLGALRLPCARETNGAAPDLQKSDGNTSDRRSRPMTVGDLFQLLPAEVECHINQRMPVVVQRGTRVLSLWLTPCQWTGRGLLGCHLKPISRD